MLESGPPATPAAPEPEGRPLRRRDDPEEKAKRSRKSSAYHVAKRAALKDGHSKEKALEMASPGAPPSHPCMHMKVNTVWYANSNKTLIYILPPYFE